MPKKVYNLQNTMLYLKNSIKNAISVALKNKDFPEGTIPEFDIEIPAERDLSLIHISEPTRPILVSRMPSSA